MVLTSVMYFIIQQLPILRDKSNAYGSPNTTYVKKKEKKERKKRRRRSNAYLL